MDSRISAAPQRGVGFQLMRGGALVLLAVCAALAGCASPTPAAWRVDELAQYADHPQVRLINHSQKPLADISVARVRSLARAADAVRAEAGVPFEAVLLEGEQPNALAGAVNGRAYVWITLGMLDVLGDDESAMAALVGHEVAHLALEHGKAAADRQRVSYGASQVLGTVLSSAGVRLGGAVAGVAVTAVERSYSRDEEREADRLGLEYARAAGYDPHGAVRLWVSLGQRTGPALLPFLSSHPQDSERLETMKSMAGQ